MIRPMGAAMPMPPMDVTQQLYIKSGMCGSVVVPYKGRCTLPIGHTGFHEHTPQQFDSSNPPHMTTIEIRTTEHWTVWLVAAVGMVIGIGAGMLAGGR